MSNSHVLQNISLNAQVPENLANKRLDQVASILFPEYSRSRLQSWIKTKELTVDGKILRAKDKVKAGQHITVKTSLKIEGDWLAQDLGKLLNVLYEDDDIIIVNKPAGLVVHPALGNKNNTLLNALLYHAPELNKVPRAGIIHRLDKDTSGLLIIARNLQAHTKLIKAMKKHAIEREYVAIVSGVMTGGGSIDAPIGRHKTKRTLMAVTQDGKPALTHYRILEKFPSHTYIRVKLDTGRTHQIRVHLAHIGYPILGDKTYSTLKLPKGANEKLQFALRNINRQMLHAESLRFLHPSTGKLINFIAPLPDDMQTLLTILDNE